MLVDDPVKRVDNMTMAWGLEGRVPFLDHELVELAATCPPELKTAHDGKGVLKQAARQVIPSEVIDRPKGYFPVPALTHLQGPYLDLVRDALYAPAAKERGLFAPEAVDRLLADPNGRLTPLRGNELWQLALLELWLQKHTIRAWPHEPSRRCRRRRSERLERRRCAVTPRSPWPCTTTRRSTWWTRWPTTSCSNSAGAG